MASTRLQDIVYAQDEFLSLVRQRAVGKSVFRNVGAIHNDALLDARAVGDGETTTIPYWNPLGETEAGVGSDDPSVIGATQKITAGKQIAVRNVRTQAWSSMDLTALLMGADPMNEIANRVGDYWGTQEELSTLAILKGIYLNNIAGNGGMTAKDMVVGDPVTDGATVLDGDLFIDAKLQLGDRSDDFNGGVLVVHSAVLGVMQKAEANAFIPKSKTDIGFDTWFDIRVISSDRVPTTTGTVAGVANTKIFTSILLTPGAIAAGDGRLPNALAVDRVEAAGNNMGEDRLYNRRGFLLHPAGFKYNVDATIAGVSPTNTEFAAADADDYAFGRVYDRKNVPVVFIRSTI